MSLLKTAIATHLFILSVGAFLLNASAAEEPSRGRNLYLKNCGQCHGLDMQGGNAKSMVDGIWQFGAERGYITRNIKHGITHLGMPSFEDSLTDAEIRELVQFLLEAEKITGATKPPPPTELETQDYRIKVDVVAEGLEIPWAIAFPGDDMALITERPGRLRVLRNGKLLAQPVSGTPAVAPEGQGGLLDVAIDPQYAENRWVYLAYSHALDKVAGAQRAPAMTRIVRGRLRANAWIDQQVIYEAPHETYLTTRHHYGCRIVFDPQGNLYFGIGERGSADHAQDLGRPNGKIHRISTDGAIPADNPFIKMKGALPSIFAYGNRNPQGLAVHPETGRVWESEHGPMGGDEINLISAGLNYGWPEISYGINYTGSIITEFTRKPGMEQPVLFWRPSIAVCGIDFYNGALFPKWNNCLFVGALKYEEVRVLRIEKDRVMHQEVILKNAGRVRDVTCGPDGAIYVVLNKPDIILRLTPIKD